MKSAFQFFHERKSSLPQNIRGALAKLQRTEVDKRSGLHLPRSIGRMIAAPNLYFMLAMAAAQIDGPALTASTTATSILPATAKPVVQAQTLRIGSQYLAVAAGRVSNIVTTPGTLTLDLRFGSVIVANGGAMALNIVAKTNVPWYLVWLLTCRAIGNGTSANMMHQGLWTSESVIGSPLPSAGGAGTHMLPNAAPAVGTGFDSSANQTADLFATWSLNNANSIMAHQWGFYEIN